VSDWSQASPSVEKFNLNKPVMNDLNITALLSTKSAAAHEKACGLTTAVCRLG